MAGVDATSKMSILQRYIVLLAFALLLTACGEQSSNPASGAKEPNDVPSSNMSSDKFLANDIDASEAGKLGEVVYDEYCADCHNVGDGHPGTMRLAARIDAKHSVLRERNDLSPAHITQIVRNGIGMMPAFRPTEISDLTLAQLAQYVAQNFSGSK